MSQTAMETIDVLESDRTNSEDVVDLTCEGSEPAVVDLTNNDSIVVVEDGNVSFCFSFIDVIERFICESLWIKSFYKEIHIN